MVEEPLGVIADQEVFSAACAAEVIETYPDDKPYPSVLILGRTTLGRPLHFVCAYDKDQDRVVLVTIYQPDPSLWLDNRRRKT